MHLLKLILKITRFIHDVPILINAHEMNIITALIKHVAMILKMKLTVKCFIFFANDVM